MVLKKGNWESAVRIRYILCKAQYSEMPILQSSFSNIWCFKSFGRGRAKSEVGRLFIDLKFQRQTVHPKPITPLPNTNPRESGWQLEWREKFTAQLGVSLCFQLPVNISNWNQNSFASSEGTERRVGPLGDSCLFDSWVSIKPDALPWFCHYYSLAHLLGLKHTHTHT